MTLPNWTGDDERISYRVVSQDDERVLLRGTDSSAGSNSFLVVSPVPGQSSSEFTARLSHELALGPHLDIDWAARPMRLVEASGVTSLILEDPGGESLARHLRPPADIGLFLRTAIAISDAVAELHQAGLLHKDIKPGNILVTSSGDRAWLTGFGIASRLPRERQTPAPPEVIAGTFAYMAPEQTGRMNRSIDTRSDLYALGVTLYEMLVGALPFVASDPMEWIHCQIARQPASPHERRPEAVPRQVSVIVMKLLAKAAEDRYRSATGLRADLQRCLQEWRERGEISDFALGTGEAPDQLIFHEKLYGREAEIRRLNAAFARVVNTGRPGLVLVSGYSGIGKSSVVNELHKSLVPARGLFAVGKFDQYKGDIPYATLAQAFQGLVRQLLSKDTIELAQWRSALSQALGFNGRLMVNLIPELAHIIGEQPPVPDLSGPEAQNRFRLVFRQFVGVFARPEHPLVLFLDDLQWLDAATLDIFGSLTDQSELGSVLLVGAYRDNEVGPDHPLSAHLDTIRKSGISIEEIALRGIDTEDVGKMIADALKDAANRLEPLARIVFAKTDGNPFFATQFVASLVDENLLHYDPNACCWKWDIDRISAKYVSGSVVDLMIERLRRLSDDSQQALRLLAAMGSNVGITTFQRISDMPNREPQTVLQEAFHAGLLFQIADAYSFAHDRVHEAAYSTIPQGERAATHWAIGTRMLAILSKAEIEADIFDVVSQFNRGAVDASPSERAAAAALNLQAGLKAKASAAYASACGYLAQGRLQLGEFGWSTDYDLAFELAIEHAECTFRSGDVGESERMIETMLVRDVTDVDKAAIYRIKVELCVVKSDNRGAVESAIEGLRLLGIILPTDPSWDQVQSEYDAIWQNLADRPIEAFADLKTMTDPKALAAMRLLAEMQPPAYFSNFNMTILVICRMINLSLERGAASTSAQGLVLLGYVMGPAFGRYQEGYRIARLAGDLASKRNIAVDVARVNHLTGLAAAWTEPLPTALDLLRSAFRGGVEAGDLYYACFEAAVIVLHVFLSGANVKDVDEECSEALEFARETGFRAGIDLIVATERAVASLSGRTQGLASYAADDFDEAAFEENLGTTQNTVVMWWYWTRKTMVLTVAGQYEAALVAAAKVHSNPSIRNMQIEQMDYHYFSALAAAALADDVSDAERREMVIKIEGHHSQLLAWAEEAGAPIFDDKHVLVAAEIARLDGRLVDAQRLYEESIRIARLNGFVQYEAIANETAARFHAGHGSEKVARSYLRDARACYARWGADAKVRQLDQMHPDLSDDHPSVLPTITTVAPVEQLDLATVIKVAQTVSGEIVLEKLVDTLMRTAIEHAGAARAVLLLSSGAGHAVEAEAVMTGKGVVVRQRGELTTEIALPEAVVQYVVRTRETVILDNALADHAFASDAYIRHHQVRSLLALPLINQGKLLGLLHLENNLAANVFTRNRLSILKLIASHAAIALENTRLYRDLAEREARIRRLVDANIIGVFMWTLDGEIFEANDSFLDMVGFDREDLAAGRLRWTELSPPEGWANDARKAEEVKTTGIASPWEKEFLRKDGSRVPVLIGAAAFGETEFESGVSYVLDLTARKRAEDSARTSDRRNRELQAELAHANRVAVAGQLSAAISHDVMQPLVGVVTSGSAGLNWLAADPPNLEAARRAFERVVSEGHRAGEVLERTRALVKKAPPKTEAVDINGIIAETASLISAEALKKDVSVQIRLGEALPRVAADRVQVQQVILNLSVNAIEAMAAENDCARRELTIVSGMQEGNLISVAVHDTGPGIPQEIRNKVFDAFYSTKSHGMGMGLAISKTIAASHGGSLWITPNEPHGTVFWFSLPADGDPAITSGGSETSSEASRDGSE